MNTIIRCKGGSCPGQGSIHSGLRALLLVLVFLSCLGSAQAVLTTQTFTPNPADLNDLDHHSAYTWRLDNLPNVTITSAKVKFDNIANWDANTNKLFMWLLDTAKNPGVSSFVDDPSGSAPVTDITDDFSNSRYWSNPAWLFTSGTAKTKLVEQSFTMTPVDYTYTFTASQLTKLNTYRANGNNIALGFDPDCHYFNDGITFEIKYDLPGGPVIPEGSAFAPLVGILGLASGMHRFRRWTKALPK